MDPMAWRAFLFVVSWGLSIIGDAIALGIICVLMAVVGVRLLKAIRDF
jgi:hypothetical protein